MRRLVLMAASAAAAIAGLGIDNHHHELVARSRPEPKRRVRKKPALAHPYGSRAERRAVRENKKHKLKGLRP